MIAIMLGNLLSHIQSSNPVRRSFAPGAFLFHRDDVVMNLYVVRRGTAKLVRYQADGQMAVLQRASAGDILADASVFSPNYHCDGIAMSETETDVISISDVRNLIQTDIAFSNAWAMELSRKLLDARRRAELASLRTVAERFNAWIVWNDGKQPDKGEWKSLAEEIGVTPEALYREMSLRRNRQRLRGSE
jgi:CRP-like cAMP-binding protein